MPVNYQLVDDAASRSQEQYYGWDGSRPEGFANGRGYKATF